MFSIARLLDAAKARAQIESDYRLAKVIGITHASLSAYRVGKALPGDKVVEQLCALSGDDAQLIFAQIQASKATSNEAQKFWKVMISRLAGAGSTAILSVVFAISLIAGYAGEARASGLNAFKNVTTQQFIHRIKWRFYQSCVFLHERRSRWSPRLPGISAVRGLFFLLQ